MDRRKPAHNSGLAKVAVQCSADTFVVNQSLVLRINICGENRHLRQAANRVCLEQHLKGSWCFISDGSRSPGNGIQSLTVNTVKQLPNHLMLHCVETPM